MNSIIALLSPLKVGMVRCKDVYIICVRTSNASF